MVNKYCEFCNAICTFQGVTSNKKYSEDDICGILDFLIDNIFVMFGKRVFQQTVDIPMGTNCAPLLADFFLY